MYQRLDDLKTTYIYSSTVLEAKVCNKLSEDSREEPCWGFPRILGGHDLWQHHSNFSLCTTADKLLPLKRTEVSPQPSDLFSADDVCNDTISGNAILIGPR